jgi:hypothetical protein
VVGVDAKQLGRQQAGRELGGYSRKGKNKVSSEGDPADLAHKIERTRKEDSAARLQLN